MDSILLSVVESSRAFCPGMNPREWKSSGEHLRCVDATYERIRLASKVKIYICLCVCVRFLHTSLTHSRLTFTRQHGGYQCLICKFRGPGTKRGDGSGMWLEEGEVTEHLRDHIGGQLKWLTACISCFY